MEDEESRTVFCGNLSEKVTEELLYELFLQAGPLEDVSIPKDPKTGKSRSFGFITFEHAISVNYACSLFDGTRLFCRELKVNPRKKEARPPRSLHELNPVFSMIDSVPLPNRQQQPAPPIAGQPPFDPKMLLAMGQQMMLNQLTHKVANHQAYASTIRDDHHRRRSPTPPKKHSYRDRDRHHDAKPYQHRADWRGRRGDSREPRDDRNYRNRGSTRR